MIENPPPWPNGARCAAAITFDIDLDSMVHLLYGKEAQRHLQMMSWGRYDEVAVPRILSIYREYGVKQTFFMPAWCMERYPHLAVQIQAEGHEIALHGYIHEEARSLPAEEEEYWLDRSLAISEQVLGSRPRGWRAPLYGFSDSTAALLCERGFVYDSSLMGDDVPYVLRTAAGELLELPVEWASDDWVQFAMCPDAGFMMQIRHPDDGMHVFEAELEAARECGGLWISVWHPLVSARPARAKRLQQFVERICGAGDVWLAPLGDVADHIVACRASGAYEPRVDELPYYHEPVDGPRSG